MEELEKKSWYPTSEKIKEWKGKFGDLFVLEAEDGRGCVFKKATRPVVKMAMNRTRRDILGGVEVLMDNCWLVGDESLKTDAGAHAGMLDEMNQVMDVKKVELKKL